MVVMVVMGGGEGSGRGGGGGGEEHRKRRHERHVECHHRLRNKRRRDSGKVGRGMWAEMGYTQKMKKRALDKIWAIQGTPKEKGPSTRLRRPEHIKEDAMGIGHDRACAGGGATLAYARADALALAQHTRNVRPKQVLPCLRLPVDHRPAAAAAAAATTEPAHLHCAAAEQARAHLIEGKQTVAIQIAGAWRT